MIDGGCCLVRCRKSKIDFHRYRFPDRERLLIVRAGRPSSVKLEPFESHDLTMRSIQPYSYSRYDSTPGSGLPSDLRRHSNSFNASAKASRGYPSINCIQPYPSFESS